MCRGMDVHVRVCIYVGVMVQCILDTIKLNIHMT